MNLPFLLFLSTPRFRHFPSSTSSTSTSSTLHVKETSLRLLVGELSKPRRRLLPLANPELVREFDFSLSLSLLPAIPFLSPSPFQPREAPACTPMEEYLFFVVSSRRSSQLVKTRSLFSLRSSEYDFGGCFEHRAPSKLGIILKSSSTEGILKSPSIKKERNDFMLAIKLNCSPPRYIATIFLPTIRETSVRLG